MTFLRDNPERTSTGNLFIIYFAKQHSCNLHENDIISRIFLHRNKEASHISRMQLYSD